MYRKDYIEKQLEQLALAIAKVIGQITSTVVAKPESGLKIADEFLKAEFDVETAKLAAMDDDHFIGYLTGNKNLNPGKLSLLADLIFETIRLYESMGDTAKANSLRKKTLLIFYYINETEKTYSKERQEKINTLKSKI